MLKSKFLPTSFRNCTHVPIEEPKKPVDNPIKLLIKWKIRQKLKNDFGIALLRKTATFRNCTPVHLGIALLRLSELHSCQMWLNCLTVRR